MTHEQIMIKLGVDASAVKSGLGKVGSSVRAWGTSLVGELKGTLGNILAGAFVIEGLNKIKENILEISRVSMETGANTNFVQNMMHKMEEAGVSFEEAAGSIARFNKTIGAAKSGDVGAIQKMMDLGVITEKTNIKTLTFSNAIHNLAIRFDSLNDKQKQSYLLSQALGKSYTAMIPVFEEGAAEVEKMNSGNFFTTISEQNIQQLMENYRIMKKEGDVSMSILANIAGFLNTILGAQYRLMGTLSALGEDDSQEARNQDLKFVLDGKEKLVEQSILQNEADKEGISLAEMKLKLLKDQHGAQYEALKLQGEIDDQSKDSIERMASQARRIMHQKSPMERLHAITPAAELALQVSNLEEQAMIRQQYKDESGANKLRSEASRIRQAPQNQWAFKFQDQFKNDMTRTIYQLEIVNRHLEVIAPVMNAIKP